MATSSEIIEFTDINGKKRMGKGFKVVKHKVRDAINEKMIDTYYVEVTVVGNRGEWTEWYPLGEFKKRNPGITLRLSEDLKPEVGVVVK